MNTISPAYLQTLESFRAGQTLTQAANSPRIQNSHLQLQTGETSQRISIEDYLAAPHALGTSPMQGSLELQLENGQKLSIPLSEMSQDKLQAALNQALHNLNLGTAQKLTQGTGPLLEQIRHGAPDPQRGPEVLVSFLRQHFQALDSDKDGWLSEQELQSALRSTQYNDAQKALLNRVLVNLSDLEEYSNDEWGDENDGVTLKDLEVFLAESKNPENESVTQSLTGWVSSANGNSARAYQLFSMHMHLLDSDHDGFVTREDLRLASQNSRFSSAERAWFAYLSEQVGEIEELSNDEWGDENDGITLHDMEAFLKTNQDHGIQLPSFHPEIRGELNLKVRDANGFNQPGRNDLSGVISGHLSLDRSLLDQALSLLQKQDIPYVSITNTCFNPQSKSYEISISTLLDDFKVKLGISPEGLPYLELSENWLPNDPILKLIEAGLHRQLGSQLSENAKLNRVGNRLYFIPKLEQLQVPLNNRYVTLEELRLKPENVRFEFDRDGNFKLHLQGVEVRGSSGDQPLSSTAQPDQGQFQIKVALDLDEKLKIQASALDLSGQAQIQLDSKEQAELAQYLRTHLDKELAEAFIQLVFLNQGQLDLQNLNAGVELNSRQGKVFIELLGEKLQISQAGNVLQSLDLSLLAPFFRHD
ncbi:hypothetical protein COW36_14465 [bacterium (Candidatus Blackallbacteria) CG17_big_fil_post_rev_8_21_14_2_50_48_46]|uniref:EF-hand domain-containing protein n=1 Tax=bacterium (Candidatus Blackallbacteria) CG17_big_fil_post_rev_8_21_14_2_50_48_46 TaxID=2014261 RepID=A0A2M7G2W2_9BACT|nr:MAG: hypothetical protein COW64_08990 [bacterium (Candidatus Blackallbacteria) CG18_big_fil_WC_8_21_14_2_50_49_26]PIW16164.1 MAG: hypothetical protein COW36_14465 [bacterium (Candidatus Blackallbacteria) CG17_big_fil_post_rev_8_21_14_2_50_48_46]PIW44251.1 MAG: hypothetical protein COW20_24795 [bacterium (Candidatus Blackallbacteria) CG13_big_fil_rev_8_21_14_2_50_49_14]